MFPFVYPRAYVDWSVPTDEDGNEIGFCNSEDSYEFYLKWLADYLYETDIPVPPVQEPLLERCRSKKISYAMIDISDNRGYSLFNMDVFERQIADGVSFEEIHREERKGWDELSEEEKEETSVEDFFLTEDQYAQLVRELSEMKNVPDSIQHADISYRAVFAALFKDVPDPKERYELLDIFYGNFSDSSGS